MDIQRSRRLASQSLPHSCRHLFERSPCWLLAAPDCKSPFVFLFQSPNICSSIWRKWQSYQLNCYCYCTST